MRLGILDNLQVVRRLIKWVGQPFDKNIIKFIFFTCLMSLSYAIIHFVGASKHWQTEYRGIVQR